LEIPAALRQLGFTNSDIGTLEEKLQVALESGRDVFGQA